MAICAKAVAWHGCYELLELLFVSRLLAFRDGSSHDELRSDVRCRCFGCLEMSQWLCIPKVGVCLDSLVDLEYVTEDPALIDELVEIVRFSRPS